MPRDKKGHFYRTLNLGKEDRKILKWFRNNRNNMINNRAVTEQIIESEGKEN